MLIEPGTTLAYKVWPLDKNEVTGEIIPVMTPKKNEVRPIGDVHLKQYTWTCHAHKKKDFHPSMARPMREFLNCFGGVLGLIKKNTDPNLYGFT